VSRRPDGRSPRRQSPSPANDKRLRAYFGGKRCTVRGSSINNAWHHLDDDASNGHFANFVPLGSELNVALRDARSLAAKGEIPTLAFGELTPSALLAQAAAWHSKWETGLAYGCSRLASFIASAYLKEPPDLTLVYACDAIYYARHRFDAALIEDTLARSVVPQLAAAPTMSQATVGIVLTQLAGLCSEFGLVREATEIFEAIDRLGVGTGSSSAIREAALMRRSAMDSGRLGISRREVYAQLRESVKLANGNPNAELSAATTIMWFAQLDEDWGGIVDLLEPLYARHRPATVLRHGRAPGVTAWNLSELALGYGVARARADGRRIKSRAADALSAATSLFSVGGSRPFEIAPGHSSMLGSQVNDLGFETLGKRLTGAPIPQQLRTLIVQTTRAVLASISG
jgi:hypothetical protein